MCLWQCISIIFYTSVIVSERRMVTLRWCFPNFLVAELHSPRPGSLSCRTIDCEALRSHALAGLPRSVVSMWRGSKTRKLSRYWKSNQGHGVKHAQGCFYVTRKKRQLTWIPVVNNALVQDDRDPTAVPDPVLNRPTVCHEDTK